MVWGLLFDHVIGGFEFSAFDPEGAEGIGGVEDDGGPDEAEAEEVDGFEGFVVEEDSEEEVNGWGEVLDDADGGESESSCGGGEPEERDGSDDAGEGEPGVVCECGCGRRWVVEAEGDKGEADGEEEDGFRGGSDEGSCVGGFSEQAIEAEGGCEGKGDPGQLAAVDGEGGDGGGGEGEGGELGGAQAFAEEEEPEEDIDEGVDVVAEAGLEDATGVNGPDEDEPVGGEHGGAGGEPGDGFFGAEATEEFRGLALEEEDEEADGDGPADAVAEDVERGELLDLFEVDGDEAPGEVGGESVEDAELCRSSLVAGHKGSWGVIRRRGYRGG